MKRGLKKLVCAGLVMTMLMGLTACGKSDDDTGNGILGGKDDKKNYANAELAKEYVYSEEPLALPDMGDSMGLRMLTMVEDTVYGIYEVYHWDEVNSENEMKLMTMNVDGSNMQVLDLQTGMNDDTAEGSDGADASEGLAEDGAANGAGTDSVADGTTEEGAADSSEATEDGASLDDMIMDDDIAAGVMENRYEYTSFANLAVSSDKRIYGIKNYYLEDYSNPENIININENYVCCWDAEGTMLWETAVENLQTEESWAYIQNLFATEDGVQLIISGDKTELMSVSAEGVFGERKELPEAAQALTNSYGMFAGEGNTITFVHWDMNGEAKLWMNTIDLNTMTVGEAQQLPDSLYMSGFSGLADGGPVADIIYTTNLGVYAINLGDTEPTQLMSFINSDISTSSMNNILVLNENQMLAFYYDNYDGVTKGGIFTKVNPEDIPDKAVVVLATNYLDYEIRGRVVDFNKSSDEYRIVVKEYQSYNTMDDYMASYTQLNNDILASGMPDILVADNNMPIESYIAKGLLADIDSLIAADEELSQKEFMQNAFDAYRVDGKLYHVIPSFYVRSVIGKSSIVGDRTTWTVQDMMNLAATLPEGTQMFGELTRNRFMYQMMQYCGSDFVDVSTGKCDFNSENFIAMLEYAKTLPEELTEDYYGEDYWMKYESQYREDRTVLMNCYMSSIQNMNYNINGYFGEDVSFIGFPTDSGMGSVLAANSQYVLSARSENLAGAWEFVRYYLTDEYQDTLTYQFPVDKAKFLENAAEATQKPYYLDENGEKVEYDETFYMNGESIILPTLTQEQVDEMISVVESVNKRNYYNENVQNIVLEEAAPFFEGQKSAVEVAGIIQSRVQVYVNENL